MQNRLFENFQRERRLVLKNIKDFLFVVLHFVYTSYQNFPDLDSKAFYEHVPKLIKSFCLIHALYGYPGEEKGNGHNYY